MPARRHAVRPGLRDLLAGAITVGERDDREIRGLTLDSRAVQPGDLFLACAGRRTHGLAHLRDALVAGAAAVAYEVRDAREARTLRERYAVAGTGRTPLIAVPGLSRQAGPIAGRFYGQPSRDLTVIGITGTNGKTSCSHYLAQSLDAPGRRCGVIGTLGTGLLGDLSPAGHTTPDAVSVQRLLAELRARGAQAVSMEVSSHGLHQGRVNGVHFDTALFTNLTRDHLDYHGDMRAYGKAKASLFESVGLRRAVVNAGDPFGRRILDSLSPEVYAVGFRLEDGSREAVPAAGVPMVLGADVGAGRNGCALRVDTPWGSGRIETGLPGR
ncbi:MAG TPA: UDP-N-acetylmuramoyl-L-alanyl-D-glutamate--2,6-diaminopimelate ligase, partial [Chromatiales bacterium]|nr:UDP-N-acetylmuramoyl-L-alanyl-D-glutamate--2,6-diaminopimelate ligase [Chromatiales bacterium]